MRVVQRVPAAVDAHDRQAAERRQPRKLARVEQPIAVAVPELDGHVQRRSSGRPSGRVSTRSTVSARMRATSAISGIACRAHAADAPLANRLATAAQRPVDQRQGRAVQRPEQARKTGEQPPLDAVVDEAAMKVRRQQHHAAGTAPASSAAACNSTRAPNDVPTARHGRPAGAPPPAPRRPRARTSAARARSVDRPNPNRSGANIRKRARSGGAVSSGQNTRAHAGQPWTSSNGSRPSPATSTRARPAPGTSSNTDAICVHTSQRSGHGGAGTEGPPSRQPRRSREQSWQCGDPDRSWRRFGVMVPDASAVPRGGAFRRGRPARRRGHRAGRGRAADRRLGA